LLEDEEDIRAVERQSRFSMRWMWLVHAVLLSLSFTLFVSAFFTRASTLQHVQQFSAYCKSILLGLRSHKLTNDLASAAKAVEYQKVKFNATMGEGSPYVGKGPEVDKAWHAILYDSESYLKRLEINIGYSHFTVGDQMITEDELEIIGMPKSHLNVKHPETGVEGYRVGLEVFHQLHCINLLRQVTYKEYYEELGNGNFAGGPEELQMHTGKSLPDLSCE